MLLSLGSLNAHFSRSVLTRPRPEADTKLSRGHSLRTGGAQVQSLRAHQLGLIGQSGAARWLAPMPSGIPNLLLQEQQRGYIANLFASVCFRSLGSQEGIFAPKDHRHSGVCNQQAAQETPPRIPRFARWSRDYTRSESPADPVVIAMSEHRARQIIRFLQHRFLSKPEARRNLNEIRSR